MRNSVKASLPASPPHSCKGHAVIFGIMQHAMTAQKANLLAHEHVRPYPGLNDLVGKNNKYSSLEKVCVSSLHLLL